MVHSLTVSEIPRLRGSILVHQLKLIEREFGREVIDTSVGKLTPAQRMEIEELLPLSWIDVQTATDLKTALASALGLELFDFQRWVVREAIGDTITILWRALLRNLWDSAIVKRTPILYRKTFDRGELTAKEITDGKAWLVLTGWPDIPEFDCVGLGAGIEAVLEYSGRSGATVTWDREKPNVHFRCSW